MTPEFFGRISQSAMKFRSRRDPCAAPPWAAAFPKSRETCRAHKAIECFLFRSSSTYFPILWFPNTSKVSPTLCKVPPSSRAVYALRNCWCHSGEFRREIGPKPMTSCTGSPDGAMPQALCRVILNPPLSAIILCWNLRDSFSFFEVHNRNEGSRISQTIEV